MAKRQTILVRCQNPECYELCDERVGWCKACAPRKPHKCLDCPTTVYGASKICEPCKRKREKEAKREYKRKLRAREIAESPPKPVKRQYQGLDDEPPIDPKLIKQWRKEAIGMMDRRDNLNQTLLAARMLQRAVCNYVGGGR